MYPDDYPPEYDGPEYCEVCQHKVDDCDCPECPKCGEQGNHECYDLGHLPCAHDSIKAFCDHIGIEPIGDALRAIDKHNLEHVWLVFREGHPKTGAKRVYYHDRTALDFTPEWLRLEAVGVGCIAWDGSDWEFGEECEAGGDWSRLENLRADAHAAYDEWHAHDEA